MFAFVWILGFWRVCFGLVVWRFLGFWGVFVHGCCLYWLVCVLVDGSGVVGVLVCGV